MMGSPRIVGLEYRKQPGSSCDDSSIGRCFWMPGNGLGSGAELVHR